MNLLGAIGKKSTVVAVGAVALLAAGGTAYAATSSSGSTPAAGGGTAPSGGHAGAPAGRSILARTDHATFEVRVKGQWVTYTYDRGKVTSVSPASITLLRPDGQSTTETITSSTRFKGVTSESAVRQGQPAVVISDGGTALRVAQRPAREGTR